MSFDPNDPRLTAYALGELDETEIAAIEAQILDSAEARASVEEIRATARLLTEEFRREPGPALPPIQIPATEGLRDAAEPRIVPFTKRPAFRLLQAGLAAGLIGAVGLAYYVTAPPAKKTGMLARADVSRTVPQAEPGPPVVEKAVRLASPAPPPQEPAAEFGAARPSAPADPAAIPALTRDSRLSESVGPQMAPSPLDLGTITSNQGQDRLAAEPRSRSMRSGLDLKSKSAADLNGPGDAPLPEGSKSPSPTPAANARVVGSEAKASQLSGRLSDQQILQKQVEAEGARRRPAQAGKPSSTQQAPSGPSLANAPTAAGVQEMRTGSYRYDTGLSATLAPAQSAPSAPAAEPPAPAAEPAALAQAPLPDQVQANRGLGRKEKTVQDLGAPAAPVGEPQQRGEAVREPEVYKPIVDNPFLRAAEEGNRLSTFSIDVDTASYSNVRRFLNEGRMPPPDAARIEELINYFPYDYPQPKGDDPFSISAEIARCPWNAEHRLARIGLKGREIPADRRPASNLVFLIDVSGSMAEENKLPLVKDGLRLLVEKLGEEDRVAVVVYAARVGVELPSTEIRKRAEILSAIDRLNPGGSTNGGAGIVIAYEEAAKHFLPKGTNRVILCTDGDFNVGVTDDGDLVRLIESKAKESKVFLSVLGFGTGNLKDSKMKALADHGNGNYAYIDTKDEARKVLVDQMSATLDAIAKDVKVQVEFNPARVAAYRLLGYENRLLKAEDFNDDNKDAGEIGAGHTVTALYELVPPGKDFDVAKVDKLKYSKANAVVGDPDSKESLTVKLRYKAPDGDVSKMIEVPVIDDGREYPEPRQDFLFAAAVAEFGMLLRNSPHKGNATFAGARELAEAGKGPDPSGYRAGFVGLVGKAENLVRPLMRAVK